jgi:hypothetical protein
MKLKSAKLANSIKVGANGEETNYLSAKAFDIDFDGTVLTAVSTRVGSDKTPTCTSIHNMAWWVIDDQGTGVEALRGQAQPAQKPKVPKGA